MTTPSCRLLTGRIHVGQPVGTKLTVLLLLAALFILGVLLGRIRRIS